MPTFETGDVVKLKSGGPTMTVREVSSEGQVWVTYFDAAGQLRGVVPEHLKINGAMLQKVDSDAEGGIGSFTVG